ncbi:MAG: HlyD family efflux transporter periplasmic adaptor subunit [Bacteroidales bacterium]|nr:HlyD family efflux transporter periplasmic adaptor subunit [Bacteroidales bacterium]
MQETEEINKIEIRSEEYQEVMGTAPSWLLRAGILVILMVIIAILIGSWFFRYPDIIVSQVSIITQNPPVPLKSFASGKVTDIFYQESMEVKRDSVIAIIENTANYQDIVYISEILDTLSVIESFPDSLILNLGELQQSYSSLLRMIRTSRNFNHLDYYGRKTQSVQRQICDYINYYAGLERQIKIMEQENKIANTQLERDKCLFNEGVYAKVDYEKAEQSFLQQKRSYESSITSLTNTQMQINQLQQEVLILELQKLQEQNTYEIQIDELLESFKSQLAKWKQTYLIIAPIDGNVTYNKVWSVNQTVSAGEIIATVIPENQTKIIGKIDIPSVGMGKIKLGQKVNIKLDNYPYMEFGMLHGNIKTISLVPVEAEKGIFYTAEVELPPNLVSNYGKKIPFSQNLTGTAEIITEDVRLLERFLNPLKSLWKGHVE